MGGALLYPALSAAVVAISFAAVLVRLSASPPEVLAAYRLLLGALAASPLAWWNLRRVRPPEAKALLLALLAGAFLGVHYALWFASLARTTIASSTVLVTLHPLFVVPASYFLRNERFGPRSLLGAALALAGAAAVGWGDLGLGKESLAGDLLAVAAALAVAVHFMIGAELRKEMPVGIFAATSYGAGALVLFALAAFTSREALWPRPAEEWAIYLALALLPTFVGHTLFTWALKFTSPAVVSVSILGEPVGASLLALLFFDEAPRMGQLLGGAFVLCGVYLFVSEREKGRSLRREG